MKQKKGDETQSEQKGDVAQLFAFKTTHRWWIFTEQSEHLGPLAVGTSLHLHLKS